MKIYRLNVILNLGKLCCKVHEFNFDDHRISHGDLTVASINYISGSLKVFLVSLNSVNENNFYCFPKEGNFYSFNKKDVERMIDYLKRHEKEISLIRDDWWVSKKYIFSRTKKVQVK